MVDKWIPGVSIDTFALIILIMMAADMKKKQLRFPLPDQKLYFWMLITNIVMLLLDCGAFLLEGQAFPDARALNLAVTTTFYALNPLISLLYLCYCDVKLNVPRKKILRLLPLYCAPLAINIVLSVLSIHYGLLFHIGQNNVYSRGSLLALSFLLSYILLAVAFIRVLMMTNRAKKTESSEPPAMRNRITKTLLLFPLPPLIGGLIQIWFNDITVIWIVTVISLLIIFINIQNTQIATDSLTGLYNRRQADLYLKRLTQSAASAESIVFTIMDIDNFKQINDRLGHVAGDNAVRALSAVLQSQCGKSDFACRYGGDEFVVISTHGTVEDAQTLIKNLNDRLQEYCTSKNTEYRLSVSAGNALWADGYETLDAFISAADKKLYQQKARLKRRTVDRQ